MTTNIAYTTQTEELDWLQQEDSDCPPSNDKLTNTWLPLVGVMTFGIYALLRARSSRHGRINSNLNTSDEELEYALGLPRLELRHSLAVLELCGLIRMTQPSADLVSEGVDRVITVVERPPEEPSDRLIEMIMTSDGNYFERCMSLAYFSKTVKATQPV